ncbi:prophage regulatory protein [Bradyrhizobium sp. USDA 377]
MRLNTFKPHSLDRFIRQRQLLEGGYVPFSHATLWRKVADKTFPAPVKLSAGVTAWREKDVLEWQRTQSEATPA